MKKFPPFYFILFCFLYCASQYHSLAETRTIVLLMGGNMNDLSFLFEKKSSAESNKVADSFAGNRFMVLPNPVYGDWQSSLYITWTNCSAKRFSHQGVFVCY